MPNGRIQRSLRRGARTGQNRLRRRKRTHSLRRTSGDNLWPERTLRKELRRRGIRFRRNVRGLPGTPDVVVDAAGLVVFVHGCFWHGCSDHYRAPRTNAAFWRAKLDRNRARDARVEEELRRRGWEVLVVWEHELRRSVRRTGARVAAAVRRAAAREE